MQEEDISPSVFCSPPVREHNPPDPLRETVCLFKTIENDLSGRDIKSIDVGDLLHFLSLLQTCSEQNNSRPDRSSRQLIPNSSLAEAVSSLTDFLFVEYCCRVRCQVREWLLKSSWESRLNLHLATHDPEDIMYCINMQMSVAREHIPAFLCVNVLIDILDEVQQMQQRIRKYLNTSGDDNAFVLERICAIINDCASLYEQFDDLNPTKDLLGGETLPSYSLKKKKDQITTEYINLAVYATDALAQTIIKDLKPVLTKFHSPKWEKMDQMDIIFSTLKDYFLDLVHWIPSFFYVKCVRYCLEHILELYLTSYFANQNNLNIKTKAALLERDRLNLLNFFGKENSEELKQPGLTEYHAVEARVEILQVMQSIIHAKSPMDVSREIGLILTEFGNHNGKAAVLNLRAISISDQPLKTKTEVILWSSAIDEACKNNPASAFRARTHCEVSPLHLATSPPVATVSIRSTLQQSEKKKKTKAPLDSKQHLGLLKKAPSLKALTKSHFRKMEIQMNSLPILSTKKTYPSC